MFQAKICELLILFRVNLTHCHSGSVDHYLFSVP